MDNPNKNRKIESAWIKTINDKINALDLFSKDLFKSFTFNNATAEQQVIIDRLVAAMDEKAIGLFLSFPWQNDFQKQAYSRGLDIALADIKAIQRTSPASASIEQGTAAILSSSVHQNELKFLQERSGVKLKRWIDELLFDTRNILHEQLGFVSMDSISDAITERIKATESRAITIAITETAQAAQRSVIKEVEQRNLIQDDDLLEVRWISKFDNKVRHLHAFWHGKKMSKEQAARNVTISPWGCRCHLKVVSKKRTSAMEDAKYKKQRKFMLEQEKKKAPK
jgi:hypothetical protein